MAFQSGKIMHTIMHCLPQHHVEKAWGDRTSVFIIYLYLLTSCIHVQGVVYGSENISGPHQPLNHFSFKLVYNITVTEATKA